MSGPVFDESELLEEIDGDWEFLEESIGMLKEDSAGLLQSVRDGFAAGDAERLWQGAHTVKSMVGNFAAGFSYELAASIEQRGRAGELEGVADDIELLAQELEKLTAALEALLEAERD